jgi:hypothetical protein
MKLVPSLAFFAGAVLTLTAIAVLAALWIGESHKPAAVRQGPKTFATPIEQATSPEALRQACLSIARVYDAQTQIIELQSAEIARLFGTLVWAVAGIGFIVGPLFLYIYFATRRHAHD